VPDNRKNCGTFKMRMRSAELATCTFLAHFARLAGQRAFFLSVRFAVQNGRITHLEQDFSVRSNTTETRTTQRNAVGTSVSHRASVVFFKASCLVAPRLLHASVVLNRVHWLARPTPRSTPEQTTEI